MARRSKFDQLPQELKDELGNLWRSGRFSIDDLLTRMQELGGDVSRSGLHRGLQEYEKTTESYRRAQNYAAFIMEKLGADGDRDLSRLLSELIKTRAFETLVAIADQETAAEGEKALAGPMDLMLLGKMIQHVTTADKNNLEFRAKVRAAALAEAAKAADAVIKERGLSEEDANLIRAKILGVKVDGGG